MGDACMDAARDGSHACMRVDVLTNPGYVRWMREVTAFSAGFPYGDLHWNTSVV